MGTFQIKKFSYFINDMTKLSIVTPTYNNINGLKRNILSVAKQSFKDKEHIIIDNLSIDGTDKLINDYSNEVDYPVTYIREKDYGIYNAFNKGIKIANGEWIHILNSDDYYFNNENLEILLNGDIKNIDVLLPPKEEQEEILQEIESRLSVCDKIEESVKSGLKKIEYLRQSILKKAFEGKLVSQDPNDPPVKELLEQIKIEKEKTMKYSKKKVKA